MDCGEGVDFPAEIPPLLSRVGKHDYEDGGAAITGYLGGLKVIIHAHTLRIKGSLCKWHLGDNFQSMGRRSTEEAIQKLSDLLHLPMDQAVVTRMDIGETMIMRQKVKIYLNHLGALKNFTRLEEPNGLYYNRPEKVLCFYDKIREQRAKHEPIPPLFQGRNVLRYELRFMQELGQAFNVDEVRAGMLYDERFYIKVLDLWKEAYQAISKIREVSFNFEKLKTRKQLCGLGVLALVERAGGQLEMITQIREARAKGTLTGKQAYDLRKAVDEACQNEEMTMPTGDIEELDARVSEAVRYYR